MTEAAFAEKVTADWEPLWSSSVHTLNVYYFDHDPRLAAQAHTDRLLSTQVTQAAMILSTVWDCLAPELIGETFLEPPFHQLHVVAGEIPGMVRTLAGQRIYRPTYRSHPLVAWARDSAANYDWLWRLGRWLADEHRFRFDRPHGNAHVLWTLERPPPRLGELPRSEPPALVEAQARYTVGEEVFAVASYRQHCLTEHMVTSLAWRRRGPPPWLTLTDEEGWQVNDLAAD